MKLTFCAIKGRMPILNPQIREYLETDFEESEKLVANTLCANADMQESYLYLEGARGGCTVRFSTDESLATYAERAVKDGKVNLATLLPDTQYYAQAFSSEGDARSEKISFCTENCVVRPITLRDEEGNGPRNVRDAGGYATSSGKMKYGMLYRGSLLNNRWDDCYRMTDAVRGLMQTELGIRAEIDLRTAGVDDYRIKDEAKTPQTANELDPALPYYKLAIEQYDKIFRNEKSLKNIPEIFRALGKAENYPVYLHCNAGADRTGTVVFLLHGLLGVSYEDAIRSFELTTFAPQGKRTRAYAQQDDQSNYVKMGKFYEDLMTYGETSQTAAENFLRTLGLTNREMAAVKELLTE